MLRRRHIGTLVHETTTTTTTRTSMIKNTRTVHTECAEEAIVDTGVGRDPSPVHGSQHLHGAFGVTTPTAGFDQATIHQLQAFHSFALHTVKHCECDAQLVHAGPTPQARTVYPPQQHISRGTQR